MPLPYGNIKISLRLPSPNQIAPTIFYAIEINCDPQFSCLLTLISTVPLSIIVLTKTLKIYHIVHHSETTQINSKSTVNNGNQFYSCLDDLTKLLYLDSVSSPFKGYNSHNNILSSSFLSYII